MQHPGCDITINMHFPGQVWTSLSRSERDSVILLCKHTIFALVSTSDSCHQGHFLITSTLGLCSQYLVLQSLL